MQECISDEECNTSVHETENIEDVSSSIESRFASVLLKLEHVFIVPGVAIDDLLQDHIFPLGNIVTYTAVKG